ncbi:MAG: cytochrome c3 family protein [Candidatus Aminicenantes bacterium]|nr:cytochrome c3 family protein [Candidatus Aminicenantes bacterium]
MVRGKFEVARLGKVSRFITAALLLLFFCFIPLFAEVTNEDCLTCHDDESLSYVKYGIEISLHVTDKHLEGTPHEGFDCVACHTDLEKIEDFPHAKRLVLPDCGSCHEEAQKEFIEGFFGPLKDEGFPYTPKCQDCHGKHKVSFKGEPRKVCGVCHQDILQDFNLSLHWNIPVKKRLTCTSCHAPHFKHEKKKFSEKTWKLHLIRTCNKCHSREVTNYMSSKHYIKIKEGNLQAPVCSDCHSKHKVLSPRDPGSKVSVANLDAVCSTCHMGYEKSIHTPRAHNDQRLKSCVACHTGHMTDMAMAESVVFKKSIGAICLTCHEEELGSELGSAHKEIHSQQIELIEKGESPNCGSCHQYHFKAPEHREFTSIKKECGDCHPKQQKEYESSAHYVSRLKGHTEAPTCTTCHHEKRISKAEEDFRGQSVTELCGRCHGNREMTMKFRINPDVLKGYNTSYHGQMYQLGYQGEKYATCVSCHDNHHILPSDNPESTIAKQNLLETCSKCHKDANENFIGYLTHYSPMESKKNPVLHAIDIFMKLLLLGTLSVFGLHTLLWFFRLLIKRFKEGPIKKKPFSNKRVLRFITRERILHLLVVLSFLTLAATGLPLKYSHTALANWFANNIVGFGAAAVLHRIAGIALLVTFAFHVIILVQRAFIRKEKGIFWGPDSLVPNLTDFKVFFQHIMYFLGLRKTEPGFDRWTYWEKFDYFAVFWGNFIIGSSGLTLMFPEFFTRNFPGWLINAAHIIHSEEALLATAFIFTVHFFNTHLRPGAAPLDDVIFSGQLSEEKFKEERPLEYKRLKEAGKYEEQLVKPLPKWKLLLIHAVGFFFLGIGFFLLTLIIIGTFF